LKILPFGHNLGYPGKITGCAEHPHKTRLPDAFKKLQKCSSAFMWMGTTSRVLVAQRPNLIFDQVTAPVPEFMDSGVRIG
jgi:hypothetical protein